MRPGDQGRWSRLRTRVCVTDASALVIRGNPHKKPVKDAFRLRRQRRAYRS